MTDSKEKSKQKFLDETFSLLAAYVINADPNTCFDNALDTFFKFPGVFFEGIFVEGWYVIDLPDQVVLNEHGWCERPGRLNRHIVDPTVVRLLPPSQPVYYFPGVERSWSEVRALVRKKGIFFPYVRCEGRYGADGLGHPGYKAAYEAARQKAFSLSQRTNPPKTMTFLSAQDLEDDQRSGGISFQIVVMPENEGERNDA